MMALGEVRTSFCEQKEAKKLYDAGSLASSHKRPMSHMKKSFLVLFFKKERLACR
jgi:hypothetical protein